MAKNKKSQQHQNPETVGIGAAEGIRTPDRSVRSRLLYPAELPLLNLIILT